MAMYGMAQRTTSGTNATASWEIRTTATDRARVMELGLTQNAATAGVYGIGRPAAIGITPTTPQTVLAEDPGDAAGTVTTAVAWGTGPTVPANFFRRYSNPATIGAGFIAIFPRGLVIGASNSIIIWILATSPVCDVYVAIDE